MNSFLYCMNSAPSTENHNAIQTTLRRQSPERQRAVLAALTDEIVVQIYPNYCPTPPAARSSDEEEVEQGARATTKEILLIQTMNTCLAENKRDEVSALLRVFQKNYLGALLKRLREDPCIVIGHDSTIHRIIYNDGTSSLDPDYTQKVRLRRELLELIESQISADL